MRQNLQPQHVDPSPDDARRGLRDLPLPEPVSGLDAYLRERELALSFSARRRENYEKYLAGRRRNPRPDYLPIKLDIENVSRCNFRCKMCVVGDWPKSRRAVDMSLSDFKRLIDEQYGLVEIKLQGIGEPLMQRDVLFEMIKYARAQHIWVRSTTNASLLHLKDNYRKLVDAGVNEIQISIDGADKRTFETIRRGSVFERVIANCKLINGYCRESAVNRTKMWTVVQRDNHHQLGELVDLASEIGFQTLVFSLSLSDWGIAEWSARNAALDVEDVLDPRMLLRLVDRGKAQGVKVRFWFATEKYRTASAETLCPWPFERAYVSSDLRVVPCCFVGNPDVFEIGKGIEIGTGFSAIWFGDEFAAFRQSHLDGRIPWVCQSCYHV